MILSDERISHLSHIILDKVWKDDWVDFRDDGQALRFTKQVISDYCAGYEKGIDIAREKINRQKSVVIGTPQWDILFEKYIREELRKKGFSD
jgi:uncharacterized protein